MSKISREHDILYWLPEDMPFFLVFYSVQEAKFYGHALAFLQCRGPRKLILCRWTEIQCGSQWRHMTRISGEPMQPNSLPDPSVLDSLLGALDRHSFATLAVIILAVLAVAYKHAGKKGD